MSTKRASDGADGPPTKRQQLGTPITAIQAPLIADWKFSAEDIPSVLPPLPKPADPKLEAQAFQHISFNSVENYESLEWVGDGWIQAISSQLIYATFRGSMKAGRLSQLRERLVCNKTLGSFLRAYGLDARIRLPEDISFSQGPKAKDMRKRRDPLTTVQKIHGDVFEAYVGAIVQSDWQNGISIATEWLKKLWSREIQDEIQKLSRPRHSEPPSASSTNPEGFPAPAPNSADLNSKVLLNQALMCRGAKLDYRDMPGKPIKDKMGHILFPIGVYFTGWGVKDELLGVGTALKKSEAGIKAAEEALKNKRLMKKYGEKKQAYLRARDEAEAQEKT